MIHYSIIILLLATLVSVPTANHAADSSQPNVRLIIASDDGSMPRIASSLRQLLDNRGIPSTVHDINQLELPLTQTQDLFISVGNASSRRLAELDPESPRLSIGTRPYGNIDDQHAHLNLEQPLCRQLALIDGLSDDVHSVSIIASSKDRTQDRFAGLDSCSSRLGISIVKLTRQDDESVNAVVRRSLDNDALLAVPNPEIYNRVNIKNVLLLSYRKRIPVIGFSESFVKAGALAALHSTPQTIARQTVSIIEHHMRTGRFAATLFLPDDYEISTNRYVSKSLGIELPNERDLRDMIDREMHHE